jgi:hypothetical protein
MASRAAKGLVTDPERPHFARVWFTERVGWARGRGIEALGGHDGVFITLALIDGHADRMTSQIDIPVADVERVIALLRVAAAPPLTRALLINEINAELRGDDASVTTAVTT